MERVAFIIESTGERLSCLLNPEDLVIRRTAGVRQRRSGGGVLTGAGLRDDPLLYTGGGTTSVELRLLFDVSLAGSTIETQNVRALTGPLWELAENSGERDRYGRPPLVRLVWGKSWNFPAIVTAVAERLEHFDSEGTPRRSWLKMRLVRVPDPRPEAMEDGVVGPPLDLDPALYDSVDEDDLLAHEVLGGGAANGEAPGGERLDVIASRYYDAAGHWRLLADFNGIDNPLGIEPGTVLRVPPGSVLGDR